jgi:hypothetical protein
MIEKFKYKGKWKLPNDSKWIFGTLTYDPILGTELEIFGSFNSIIDRSDKEIIVGKTSKGNITLLHNWYRGSKNNYETGITISTYRSQIVFTGENFHNIDDIKFSHVIFRVFNLFQWLNLSGQEIKTINESKEYEIKQNEIPEINFKINNNCNGVISFDSPYESQRRNNEINLHEEVYVTLNYIEKETYNNILNDIYQFISFVTLFSFEQSYPIRISFKDEKFVKEDRHYEYLKFIRFNYRNSEYNENLKIRYKSEHLVNYEDIIDDFPLIIQKWFIFFSEFESVIVLILKYFKHKYLFSTDKFMDIIRAVENFHRIEYKNERIPIERFNQLTANILEQVNLENEKDREWLENMLKGNEPSLKDRIKELIENNKNTFTTDSNKNLKRLYYNATTSRNYYTHYDKNSKNKALNNKELFELTSKLLGLLISSILKKLEIESKHYENQLKYLLN